MWTELEAKKEQLESLIEYKTKGAIIRLKSQWYNEGEKNTKYFLNLEKRHCKQGTITQLKISEKDFADTDKEILNECESFYRTLYSSKTNNEKSSVVFFPPQQNQNYLTNAEQLVCEGLLNREECLQALNSMNSDKTPRTDGLPCEFFQDFLE